MLITNVGKVPCTDKQSLTADVCYLRSTDVFRDSVNCIPCIHISPLHNQPFSGFVSPPIFLGIVFVSRFFSVNPFLNSFQSFLRVCLPRGVSTCTWMNLQTELAKTNLDKKLQIGTDLSVLKWRKLVL